MRLALLSDVHGNPIALEAVLADSRNVAVRMRIWCSATLSPSGTIRLPSWSGSWLPGVRFIEGNTDRYVVARQRPYPAFADAESDPGLIPRLVEVAHSFACTQGIVTAAGWFDWLSALHLEERMLLPDAPWWPKRRPISCVSDIRTG